MEQETEDFIERPVVSASLMVDFGSFEVTVGMVCADFHKVLCSAGEFECKGCHQNFYFGSDSGFVFPVHSKSAEAMRMHLGRLVYRYGRNQLIPVYIEVQFPLEQRSEVTRNQNGEQFSAAGSRVWQSSALVSPKEVVNKDLPQMVITFNQLKRHLKMSRWETMKRKNPWKLKFSESE